VGCRRRRRWSRFENVDDGAEGPGRAGDRAPLVGARAVDGVDAAEHAAPRRQEEDVPRWERGEVAAAEIARASVPAAEIAGASAEIVGAAGQRELDGLALARGDREVACGAADLAAPAHSDDGERDRAGDGGGDVDRGGDRRAARRSGRRGRERVVAHGAVEQPSVAPAQRSPPPQPARATTTASANVRSAIMGRSPAET
jgi:hypothetical protein